MKPFYAFCRAITKFLFILLYRHKTYGMEHIPKGRAIIAPNHVSFYDPPLIGISCPEEIHFLAKDMLFEKTWLGPIIRRLNAFPVSGNVSDLKTIKSLVYLLQEGEKITIFPEGFRTFDGKLAPIKPGIALIAMRAKAPIVPAYIHGAFEVWPRKSRFPKLWGRTFVVFGSPIDPEDYRDLDKKQAQQAITDEIKKGIEKLMDWHAAGAIGSPP